MILSKIKVARQHRFHVLVADTDTEEIGVSEFKRWSDAKEFQGMCHMFNRVDGKYDDGQGRQYDILDEELI